MERTVIDNPMNYYEFPLNERMRCFLRTESLISCLKYDYAQENYWDNQRSLMTVISLYRFLDQADLKKQLLQAIESYANGLKRLLHTPNVDLTALNRVLEDLDKNIKTLSQTHTQFEKLLQENPILSQYAARQFSAMTPSFDLPELHHWLNLNTKNKQLFLDKILTPLGPIIQSLTHFLNLVRQGAKTQILEAPQGMYKKQAKPSVDLQMIGIGIDKNLGLYPKISANRQCVNISFYEFNLTQTLRPKACDLVPFELTSYYI